MFEIDRLSDEIKASLEKEGLLTVNTRLCAFCDRDLEYRPGEIWLLCDEEYVYAVFGELPNAAEAVSRGWQVKSVEKYPLKETDRFFTEELRSGGRLLCSKGEETY